MKEDNGTVEEMEKEEQMEIEEDNARSDLDDVTGTTNQTTRKTYPIVAKLLIIIGLTSWLIG